MYYVYMIEGKDGYLYTGITRDLAKRLREHNSGLVSLTKNRRPFVLRHKEVFRSRVEVALRERKIKGLTREKKENLYSLR